jgi:hypothetical protein
MEQKGSVSKPEVRTYYFAKQAKQVARHKRTDPEVTRALT